MKFAFVYWIDIKKEHENKDVFLVPYYLGKIPNVDCKIVGNFVDYDLGYKKWKGNLELENVGYKGLFKKVGGININIIKYIIKKYKEIDILGLIHITRFSILYMLIYKLLNRHGKVYIKLDDDSKKRIKDPIHKYIVNLIVGWFCDTISVETLEGFDKYIQYGKLLERKLVYMPNGYNNELLEKLYPSVKTREQKDNIIFTVSRIGSHQKNHELMLSILEKLNLRDWKVYLIGPIDDSFRVAIKKFFDDNNELIGKFIFTGLISDKKQLYHYYNNAKIFLFTSRREGFPLVFPDALYFGNRIITTEVSSSSDVVKNGLFGDIIYDNGDVIDNFLNILQDFIDGKKTHNSFKEHLYCLKHYSWADLVKVPAKNLGLI